MRVVFLDVDGVLNNDWSGFGGFMSPSKPVYTTEELKWDQKCVDELRRIVETSGAKIVISSFWRIEYSVDDFLRFFETYGWKNAPVIDRTTVGAEFEESARFVSATPRVDEIVEWLDEHPDVTEYAILDDMTPSEFCAMYTERLTEELCVNWGRLKPHYVQTDIRTGLDPQKADFALTMFPD